jgi:hypothetical protein
MFFPRQHRQLLLSVMSSQKPFVNKFVGISPEPLVNTSLTLLLLGRRDTKPGKMRTVILACLVASAGAFGTVRPPLPHEHQAEPWRDRIMEKVHPHFRFYMWGKSRRGLGGRLLAEGEKRAKSNAERRERR